MKTQSHLLWLALAIGVAQCVPNTNNDIVARGPPGRHDGPQEWHEKDFRLETSKAGKVIPQDWDQRARLSVRDRDGDGYPRAEKDEEDGGEGPPLRRYGEDGEDGPKDGPGPKGGPKGKKAKPPHDRDGDEEEDDEDHRPRPEGYGQKEHSGDTNERPAPPHCYPGAPESNDYGPDRSSCTEDQLERAETSGQQWQDLDHPDDDHREERPEGGSGYLDKRQQNGRGSGDGDGPDGDDGDGPDGDDGGRRDYRNAAGRNTYPVLGGVVGVAVVMAVML